MKIIILAAGMGMRLNECYEHSQIPKCLVDLENHRTLLSANLKNIQSCDDIEDITIVTGYKHDKLEKYLGNLPLNELNIKLIYNSEFQKSVIYSVWKGFENINKASSVLLLNGDTYFEKNIFTLSSKISHQDLDTITLFGHITNKFYDDDMLININEKTLLTVGKNLKRANGVSSGAILMCYGGLQKYLDTINIEPIERLKTHHGILQLISDSGFDIDFVELGSRVWLEVDNKEDLYRAKRYFAVK